MKINAKLSVIRRAVVVFDRLGQPVPPDRKEQNNWVWEQIPAGAVVICYYPGDGSNPNELSGWVQFPWGFVDLSKPQLWSIARQLLDVRPADDVAGRIEQVVQCAWERRQGQTVDVDSSKPIAR